MNLSALVDALERIAPTRHAESWDNVGLLAGDLEQAVSRVLLTIDYTPAVADEARAAGADVVIAYHPPIFQPVKRLTSGGGGGLVFDAIRRGIALYSPHTALDVAEGGTNDLLADAIGLKPAAGSAKKAGAPPDPGARSPLRVAGAQSDQHKLVTFVPEQAVERVSAALFEAGAGRIGPYSACSFRSPGTGTFFGEAGTHPAVGQSGRLEHAPELRIETILPAERVAEVVRALRASHPYEEPAFDLLQLAPPPEGVGLGRVGDLVEPTARPDLFDRIKRELGLNHLLIAGPTEGVAKRAAVCAGACGDLLDDAIKQKVDLYLTGEMRHHDAIKAARAGVTVVCTLHSNSERAVLRRLKGRIEQELPGLAVTVSEVDRDPFSIR